MTVKMNYVDSKAGCSSIIITCHGSHGAIHYVYRRCGCTGDRALALTTASLRGITRGSRVSGGFIWSLQSYEYNLQAEAFKHRVNNYLTITNGVAYWTHYSSCNSYTQEHLVEILEFLVDNIFVVVGDAMFRQCIGIPMGTDCTQLVAMNRNI